MKLVLRNKEILKDAESGWGWDIKDFGDLVLAAMGKPEFETVYDVRGVVESVLYDVIDGHKSFDNIDAFCEYCSEMYI